MEKMKTYPEMNRKILEILRLNNENPVALYAAARIEELEGQNQAMRQVLEANRRDFETVNVSGLWQGHPFTKAVEYINRVLKGE